MIRFKGMEKVIELQQLSFSYPFQKALWEDFSYEIKRGEFIGILGKNGVGKTTFIDLLIGMQMPSVGAIKILGKDPYREKSILSHVSFCSREIELPVMMTVVDYLNFYLSPFKHKSVEKLNYYLELFGVNKKQVIGTMSIGEKAKVQAIGCLLREAQVILIDELTSVMDLKARQLFLQEIKTLVRRGAVAVVATNIVEELNTNVDKLFVIGNQKITIEEQNELKTLFIKGGLV